MRRSCPNLEFKYVPRVPVLAHATITILNLARAQMPRVLLHKLGPHTSHSLSVVLSQNYIRSLGLIFQSSHHSLPPASSRPTPSLRTRPNTSLVASASLSAAAAAAAAYIGHEKEREKLSGHRRQSGGACRDVSRRIWVDDFAVNVTELHRF